LQIQAPRSADEDASKSKAKKSSTRKPKQVECTVFVSVDTVARHQNQQIDIIV